MPAVTARSGKCPGLVLCGELVGRTGREQGARAPGLLLLQQGPALFTYTAASGQGPSCPRRLWLCCEDNSFNTDRQCVCCVCM